MLSILITHYNRPKALKKCIDAFKEVLTKETKFEIVVSDDGSPPSVQNQFKKLPIDKLVLSASNKGLTSNLNTGIRNCSGDYILYCQEDFIPKTELNENLQEILQVLDSRKADMVRMKANYTFPKLFGLTENIKLIPKFSWKNFYYNTFQYSDHPFITTSSFFKTYGYFLENTSGAYGENEYAIRIMKSNAKIAIMDTHLFKDNLNTTSVIEKHEVRKKRRFLKKIGAHKLVRAVRLHLEYVLYNPKKRGLITLKNKRIN